MRGFEVKWLPGAAALLVLMGGLAAVDAQDPSLVLVDGGLQFPDGTVQSSAAVGGAPVEDTGQTTCAGTDGVPRDCAGTGEDGEFQAGVEWPTPRFTDNGDGTITDDLTSLIWLKDANCAVSPTDWQGALDFVETLNTTSQACAEYAPMTFTDWRLPNVKELGSLVDYGTDLAEALPEDHPFLNVVIDPDPAFYWSSTTFRKNRQGAWRLLIGSGGLQTSLKDGSDGLGTAWAVRGGA